MKTLLFLTIMLTFITCKKDEEAKTGHTIRYVVDCNPGGFDLDMTVRDGENVQSTVTGTHWDFSFQSHALVRLLIKAKALNKIADIKVVIYHNDTIMINQTNLHITEYPFVGAGIVVPE